ncbi:MAG TPA: flagellar protein FlgN [Burkholderiales bacterium]|nr:flagellar protein FlgN [Burkholderiales bacterium]
MTITSSAAEHADSTAAAAVAVVHNLACECTAVESFAALLAEERAALLAQDADTLQHITLRKAEATHRIAALVDARNRALTAGGFAPGRAGIESFLDKHPQNTSLWQRLRRGAARTQGLNHTVGQLINWRLAATEQALAVLRQGSHAAPLYSATGQPAAPHGARRLATA